MLEHSAQHHPSSFLPPNVQLSSALQDQHAQLAPSPSVPHRSSSWATTLPTPSGVHWQHGGRGSVHHKLRCIKKCGCLSWSSYASIQASAAYDVCDPGIFEVAGQVIGRLYGRPSCCHLHHYLPAFLAATHEAVSKSLANVSPSVNSAPNSWDVQLESLIPLACSLNWTLHTSSSCPDYGSPHHHDAQEQPALWRDVRYHVS